MDYVILYLWNKSKNNMDLQQLNTRIQTSIDNVINGGSSEYIKFTTDDDTIWTFRVSNHMANPIRTDDNTISLVIELPSVDEDFGSWGIRKKQFRNINNQYFLNEDGCFTENFCDIEEFTSYIID